MKASSPEGTVPIDQADTVQSPLVHPAMPDVVDPAAQSTEVRQAIPNWRAMIPGRIRTQPAVRSSGDGAGIVTEITSAALACAIVVGSGLLRWQHLGVPGLSAIEVNAVLAAEGTQRIISNTPFAAGSAAYLVLLRWWMNFFGTGDVTARELSALCGTLTVAVVYVLARRLAGPRAALLASILLAVAPLHIAYSQQVSPYALLTLLSALLVLLTLLVLEQPQSVPRWAGWIVGAMLLVSVATSGVILVISLGVVCALKLRYSIWHLTGLAAALASVVLLRVLESHFVSGGTVIPHEPGSPMATMGLIINTLIAYGAWSGDATSPGVLALPFVILVGLGVALLTRTRREMEAGLLLAWLLGTPVVLFLTSFATPVYDLSLVLSSLPAYTILATVGVVQLARLIRSEVRRMRWMRAKPPLRSTLMRTTANVAVIVISGVLLAANAQLDTHYFTAHQGEPWRTVAQDIAVNQRAGDIILTANFDSYTQSAFDYYYVHGGQDGSALPRVGISEGLVEAKTNSNNDAEARIVLKLSQLLSDHNRVWVLMRNDGGHSLQDRVSTAMPMRFTQVSQRGYTGDHVVVVVSLWVASGKGK